MKKYEILTKDDYRNFDTIMKNYIGKNEHEKKPFKKMNITVKSWRKDKTSQQLKFYWVVMAEMVKAFESVGYEFTKEECHEFVKNKHGFVRTTTLKNGTVVSVTDSISDKSDTINIKVMMDLIDFAIRWTAINLNYAIQDPR